MCKKFTLVHGFKLNVSMEDGKPSIFLIRVFPEQIDTIEPVEGVGTKITLKFTNNKTTTLQVTQSVQDIKTMMEQCKELDKQAQSNQG